MKEVHYKELCEACDHLLREGGSSESRVAISWLHILKWHPSFLEQYKHLFYEINIRERKRIFLQLMRYSLITFVRIFKGIWSREICISKNIQQTETDFLIISHLIDKELIYKKNDFYFGDIPSKLNEFGMSSTFAMINHIGIKKYMLPNDWGGVQHRRIVLSKSISFVDEIKIYLTQIKEALRLRNLKSASEFHTRVFKEASMQALSSSTANNLRIKKQVSEILKTVKPKYIMVTYEGHAWERLIFSEARKIDSNIKCIGYQYALINGQHAVYRGLGDKYDPDIIATSGVIDLEKLEKRINNNKIININIGTSKKILYESIPNNDSLLKGRTCLVLADGGREECIQMLLFANDLASLNPEIQFIFRLHPRTNKQLLLNQNPVFKEYKSNITWSSSSLEKDYEMSHLAIYRDSNAIFGSASFGVLPIFFGNDEGDMTDPLLDLADVRLSLKEVDQFYDIVKVRFSHKHNKLIKIIFEYCNKKYDNLNIEPLIRVLSN